jgi:hypothetical protein
VTGCSIKPVNTKKAEETDKVMQKMVVVVVDKKTKTPVKDAKVFIVGMENQLTTDEMGKTQEVEVEVNRDYFERYKEEVKSKVRTGLLNIVVIKDGYGKHMELDYPMYPGSSTAVAKVEITQGNKITKNINKPDVTYIENIAKSYEKFEGQGARSEAGTKYKVTLKDEQNKPLEGAKVVIPEALTSLNTDKKGVAEFDVPLDNTSKINFPVKKDYGEITVLVYKEGFMVGAYLKAHVSKDGKGNSLEIKLKASKNFKVDYLVADPDSKWVDAMLDSYK